MSLRYSPPKKNETHQSQYPQQNKCILMFIEIILFQKQTLANYCQVTFELFMF